MKGANGAKRSLPGRWKAACLPPCRKRENQLVNEPILQSRIDAASTYEALFVPALFGQWVSMVADAAAIGPGQRVLDVACGTGVLAREIAARTGKNGHVVGLDPNPGMLAFAGARQAEIEWTQGVAESLPFPDQSFDAVVSQFGLMFFEDRGQSIREMLRVLRQGGRYSIAVWDAVDNIPGYLAELALIESIAGEGAANAVRAPFCLGDRAQLSALFESAGAMPVEIATKKGRARFPDVSTMVGAELRGWLPLMGIHLDDDQIEAILQRAEVELRPYVAGDGEVVFDVTAHIVSGRVAGASV
jgi:SAM-dependent methyltransferase